MKRWAFLRQHGLWVGFVTVLISLLVILGLQYGSLVALEKTSVAAHRDALKLVAVFLQHTDTKPQ